MIRRYSRVRRLDTFEDRFNYLRLQGSVGRSSFGFDRHVNQKFYKSSEWKSVRDIVIARDNGCDLGIDGYEIHANLLVHHMNPIDVSDILEREDWILNPEFLITTTHLTHNAIHYGDENQIPRQLVERRPGDTELWERV
ncbi:MAG: hypothetical protein LC687_00945 [Actinobacteria bacterium]|nr:hypothetical protein [Actinomycetota bacterium]